VAEKRILVSDLSGKEIGDRKDAASVTVEFADKRRGQYHLDVTKDEGDDLAAKGTKVVES
jgi:hypothetical protein